MALINWTDEYTTGLTDIDDQHRHLVDIINRFDEASGKGKGSRVVNEILNDLLGYTQEHFSYEEKKMIECGYGDWKRHQNQHRQLLQEIERLQFDFNGGQPRMTGEAKELLKHWLTSHILTEDQGYVECLQGGSENAEACPEDPVEAAT